MDRVAFEGSPPHREQEDERGPQVKDMDMPFDGKRMIFGGFLPIFDTAPPKG